MTALERTLQVKDEVCRPEHAFHAFDTLYCSLTGAKALPPAFKDEKYALFVTWNTLNRKGEPRLRGCIGNFSPMAIRSGISEYALISAFEDARFRPIQLNELDKLECVISLLTDFEDADDYLDWTIGVHGIHIVFSHPFYSATNNSSATPPSSTPTGRMFSSWTGRGVSKRKYSACYLPDVMPAQGWTKIEAIDSAIRKSGWDGRINDELRRSISLRRYQSRVVTVTWKDYVTWRMEQGGSMDS